MPDPKEPISLNEQSVFGVDTRRHPVTGYCLEINERALSEREQGYIHLNTILREQGEPAMLDMRRRLDQHYGAAA